MTQMLKNYLEFALGYNNDKNKVLELIPKHLAHNHHGEIKPVRELLQSEAIESTTLIQSEVYNTVLEGAEPAKAMREILPVIDAPSNSFTWTIGESGSYMDEIAEGAEIPVNTQDYTSRNFTVRKYGERPLITNELIEDSLFNIVELELRKSGMRAENTINQKAISTVIDNAANEHDTDGSDQGLTAISTARGKVTGDNRMPGTLVMHPDAESIVLEEFIPSQYKNGNANVMDSGNVPTILGLNAYTVGVTADGTETWQYDSDGDIGMVVMDAPNAAAIAMKRDITVERFNDPIRDLTGMSVTTRFATNYLDDTAMCRIKY